MLDRLPRQGSDIQFDHCPGPVGWRYWRMEMGLRGRGALIGGASKGLGRACAEELAAEGCRLVLWSRGGDALAAAADELRQRHGVEVHTAEADAADPDAPAKVVQQAAEALGRVD